MPDQESMVITGVGIISPIGESKETFWESLRGIISGIKEITMFDTSKYGYQSGGEITGFDPGNYLGKKGHKFLSRTTKLLMSAAFLCLKDAGIKDGDRNYIHYGPEFVGAVVGTTYGVFDSICSFDTISLLEGPQYVSPMAFPNLVMNSHAGYLAIKENIQGLNVTVATGYCASIDAMGVAIQYLSADQIKCMIVGGLEELSEATFLSYLKQGMISRNAYIGEGCGICSIEKLKDALYRKAKIYGEIAGYGSVFFQDEQGLKKAIDFALEEAGMDKDGIDWVIKGMNLGERERQIESETIKTYFGSEVPISDFRSLLGDSYSAGGSFQIIAGLGFLEQKLAKNFLTISIDPCGNCSALIIKQCSEQ
jgi:3-oxoacyl-[acyl-carrier-protein] synthase II